MPIEFTERCKGINRVLVIAKNIDDYRFGGFTMTSFDKTYEFDCDDGFKIKDEYKKDKNAFIFSLDLKKIYNVLKIDQAICNDNNTNNIVDFTGGFSLCITKDRPIGFARHYVKGNNYEPPKYDNEMTGGVSGDVQVLEIEIYQII